MIKVLLVFICTIFLYSCNINTDDTPVFSVDLDTSINITSAEPVYRKITASEAREIMEATKDFILLDVRTEEEFKEKRIEGAILIPDYEISARAESELPNKDALILVYCLRGRRSANVAHELVGMGYTNVYDFGGIQDWPYETVSG